MKSRNIFKVLAGLGLLLVVMPFAFSMFSRAPKGATMLQQFRPFMTSSRLTGFQDDMRQVGAAVQEVDTSAALRLEKLTPGAGIPPGYRTFDAQWPAIDDTMTGLLDRVQANLGNYQAVAALPSFKLFPWFFVIPGLLTLTLAGVALARPGLRTVVRGALVAIGVGLVAAPLAFQMFQRAPAGGRMMAAFKSIETNANVSRIQGYFSTMAGGQGAIRLQVVPALEASGLTSQQVAADYPAITKLDGNWVHILNDMTPMIGAMSDSVSRYQAIAALPPFPLFPWFFVIPGVLLAGLAVVAGRTPQGAEPAGGAATPSFVTQGAP